LPANAGDLRQKSPCEQNHNRQTMLFGVRMSAFAATAWLAFWTRN